MVEDNGAKLVWNDVITFAEQNYNDSKMVAWLKRLYPISMDDSTFQAAAQFEWPATIIMRDYKDIIEECLYQITLEEMRLTVEVKPELFSSDKPKAQDIYLNNSIDSQKAYFESSKQSEKNNDFTPVTNQTAQSSYTTNSTQFTQKASLQNADAPTQTDFPDNISTQISAETVGELPDEHLTKRNRIDSNKTFDTFLVGDSNSMAQASAKRVAEMPGEVFNPFFLYSKSGLGKTHLLMAIYNYIKAYYPNLRALYVTAEQFLQDYIREISESRSSKTGEPIMTHYRNVDVLLIDDVQFLESKQESQEFFFSTFNDLIEKKKQVVISADRSPKELNMDERMTSRFMSGLSQNIQPPTFELKLAIVNNFYQRRSEEESWYNAEITEDQLTYIASISSNNIREIEGFMTTIMVKSAIKKLQNSSLTTEDIDEEALQFFDINKKKVEVSTIVRVVEKHYGVSHDDMVSSSRKKPINQARQIAWYLARSLTDESFEALGKRFGNRNHATVINGVDKIERQVKTDRHFYDELEHLKENIINRT